MASASRSTDSQSAPVDLRIFNWSAVLDVLRGTVEVLEQNPSFVDGYDRDDAFEVYRHVATSVESQTEIGDSWRRVLSVELTVAQLDNVTTALEACDRSVDAYGDLPDTLPNLPSLARDMRLQHEARR